MIDQIETDRINLIATLVKLGVVDKEEALDVQERVRHRHEHDRNSQAAEAGGSHSAEDDPADRPERVRQGS